MDDHSEPTSEALARAAQALAVTVSVGEALARLRAQRAHDRADAEERTNTAARSQAALRHETARLEWSPTLDDHTLRRMSATEMLHAWAQAGPYRELDPTAARAGDLIEQRLRDVHPEAMSVYDTARRGGLSPQEAMARAGTSFRGEFGLDPAGTPLHWQRADAAAHQAATAYRADDPSTPRVDEATRGQRQAAALTGGAETDRARALSGLAFPVSIEDAMATAPRAAKAMLALPAAPVRRQITAAPAPVRH